MGPPGQASLESLSLVSGTDRTGPEDGGQEAAAHGMGAGEVKWRKRSQVSPFGAAGGAAVGPRAQAANSLSGLRGDTPPEGLLGFPLGGTLRHFRTGPVSGGMCPALPQRPPRSPPLGPEMLFLTEALSSFRSADRGRSQRRLQRIRPLRLSLCEDASAAPTATLPAERSSPRRR